MKKRKLGAIAIALVFIVLLGFHFYQLYGQADDSYISFRYSKNLATGHGLRWNVDEPPVEGYTNFLWVLAGALFYLVAPQSLPQVMSGLGIAFFLASLFVFGKLIGQGLPERKSAAWLVALLPAASGPLVLWAASGMETSLFAFLVLTCFYLLRQYEATGQKRFYQSIWILAFLAFLVRPDGLLLALVLAFYFLLFKKGGLSKAQLLPFSLYYALPFVLYNAWRVFYFSSILPNTFYAKAAGPFLFHVRKGLLYTKDFTLAYLVSLIPLFVFLAVRRKKAILGTRAFPGLILMFILVFTLYIICVGGDYMAMYRFFAPLLLLVYLLLGVLFLGTLSVQKGRAAAWALFVLALILTFLPSTPLDRRIWGGNKASHYGCYEGFKTERWYVNRYITIGKLFSRLRQSPSDTMVIPAIGAIGYFSGMNILDYFGLTDSHIARRGQKAVGQSFIGHEKTDIDYILSRKPAYLMGYKRFSSRPVSIDHPQFNEYYVQGDPQRLDLLRDNYEVRNIWVEDRLNGESGYLSFLEIKRRRPA